MGDEGRRNKMIKRPFFAITKQKLRGSRVWALPKEVLVEIPLPKKATFVVKGPFPKVDELMIGIGDRVRTGQKVRLATDRGDYFISTVTGTVSNISPRSGYMGQACTAVSVNVAEKDQPDDEFGRVAKDVSLQNVIKYLASLPGAPDFGSVVSSNPALEALVITGVDSDLLVTKNQFVVDTEAEALKQGIETLRKVSGIQKIILLVPEYLKKEAEKTGAEVRAMDPLYPDTLPRMVMKNLFGKAVPVGKRCEDLGIGFVSAEAVVALQKAFSEGQVPLHKLVTVIKKDGSTIHAKARIGTPVKDVLKALQIETSQGDRVVLGGAMAGLALFSEEEPIEPDTDAILVQDKTQLVSSSDNPCVNCGECVRVCPAKMPVNMLIRYLENGRFEEAAQGYDLLSCIECGLCTYACIVKIPIFHYIMLGKQEISRIKSAEEAHA
jgi:electron transport complex protein RnfC